MLRPILDATFRANPRYELVVLDRLPAEQQALLGELRDDPDFYGILRPRDGAAAGLGLKAICRDSALLYLTLANPGPLPGDARAQLGADGNQAIAELVLDGVLEIGHQGTFVAGATAYDALYASATPVADAQPPRGRLAQLAHDALRYGQALEIDDADQLSQRLYCYNRLPATARWRRRYPSAEAVARELGIDAGGRRRARLERHWTRAPRDSPRDPWRVWRAHDATAALPADGTTWKLYISPAIEHIAEAFDATLATLTESPAPVFKMGSDLYGLLRPDKLIAYFPSRVALAETAERLGAALAGCPAHGVPFSADLAGDGLLSWGMDPPRAERALSWQARESWRLWVTNRLAVALLAARAARDGGIEPWRFALERLRLDGVDVDTWAPLSGVWRAAAATNGGAE